MLELKNEKEAKGVRFRGGLEEVADIAAPIWNVRKHQDAKDTVKGNEKDSAEYSRYK